MEHAPPHLQARYRYYSFYDCLCRYGLTVSPATFAAQCDRFLAQAEPPARADGFTVFERRIHTLCGVLGLHVPAEHIPPIANTIVRAWQRHIGLDPDSRPVLQTLQQRYTLPSLRTLTIRHMSMLNTALEATGHSAGFCAVRVSVGVARASASALDRAMDMLR